MKKIVFVFVFVFCNLKSICTCICIQILSNVIDPKSASKLSSRGWEKKQINTLACVSLIKKKL